MFIGHFAVGFAAKKYAPRPSLGTYIMAINFLDLLWPIFLLLGIERVEINPGNTAFTPLAFVYYPYSHSLLAAIFWATLFSATYYFLRKEVSGSGMLWLAVFSHWILDAVSHKPDLPLFPGSTILVGFGLWNSVSLTMIVEITIFIIGIILYASETSPKNKLGTISFWSLVGFLFVSYLSNAFGPPPPSEKFLMMFSPSLWLFVFWGYWIERKRELVKKMKI